MKTDNQRDPAKQNQGSGKPQSNGSNQGHPLERTASTGGPDLSASDCVADLSSRRSFSHSVLSTAAKAFVPALHKLRWPRFQRLLHTASTQQREWLMQRTARCRETTFGREHDFANIHTVDDFRRRVPISRYDYFAPYINAVAAGDFQALIPEGEELLRFTITTGTTGTPKLNPVTTSWLKEYRYAWELWGVKLFADHPNRVGSSILQMAGTWDMGRTEGGIPISMVSALLARNQKAFLKKFYAVPSEINDVVDPITRYYTALRLCITEPIGWLILMNPGMLVRLAEISNDNCERLIRDLHDGTLNEDFDIPSESRRSLARRIQRKHTGRARELERIVEQTGTLYPRHFWNDPVIACWLGGTAGFQTRYLSKYYGDVPKRDLGLVSSEGRHTIPLDDERPEGVLAITSGFYEFVPVDEIDSDQPTALEGHELERDQYYYLLMTTSAGFYRFNIGDIVCCRGFVGEAPVLEFIQKGDCCGDLEGEKVTEYQFLDAAHEAARKRSIVLGNVTAVPYRCDGSPPHYVALIEQCAVPDPREARQLLHDIDQQLMALNFLYSARRREGVLGAPKFLRIPAGGWEEYICSETMRRGTGDAQYKHPGLVQDATWIDQFDVIDTVELTEAQHPTA